ncbi:O-acyltransferase like protein-like [Orbicella faveolata]|uniref:O-acyltransferase like protein-like n=1 Tax=Orbicella faveolata TaxID=48498 RepID=UPI0009E4B415|nr:O-acyltransferase like protein-like [Orbicella faveolata]
MRHFVQCLRANLRENVLLKQPKSFQEPEEMARLAAAVKTTMNNSNETMAVQLSNLTKTLGTMAEGTSSAVNNQQARLQVQMETLTKKIDTLLPTQAKPDKVAAYSEPGKDEQIMKLQRIIRELTNEMRSLDRRVDALIDGIVQRGRDDYPILWGICAPKQCSEEDVTNAVQDIFSGANQEFDSTVFKLIPHTFDDAAAKSVFCNKKSEYTTGVITTFCIVNLYRVLCGVILYLCLVGTIVDIAVSFAKSNSSPLNANNELVSIGGVSIAPDQSIPDADKTSLLQSSSEFNLKECTNHQQEPVLPNVVVRFFLCFSLIQNTNRIMDTKVPPSVISSINGMRVLSMWWVILGHTYDFSRRIPVSNLLTSYDIIHRFTFQAVGNGTYSVDSFFFLSGLLVAYLSLRHMEKKNGELPLFKYYFRRFWRLTPTYMFVLLFLGKLLRFLGEGPLWHPEKFVYQCRKYWWTNLLYINNFYPTFDAQVRLTAHLK